MNHYVYNIDFSNNMSYIGVRSCTCNPVEDTTYLGSSKIIPAEAYRKCVKTILKQFNTRPEAVMYEAELHKRYNVKSNPKYYNQVNQTSTKFDQQGCTMETHEHLARSASKLRGRSKEEFEYLEDKAILQRSRLTPKQVAWQERRKGVAQGPNPKKSLIGINSPATKPWYYITTELEYIEVFDSVLNYINTTPNCNLINRTVKYAMEQRQHKPIVKGKLKGYTFGRLHTKPDYITQDNLDMMIKLCGHTNTRALLDLHKASKMGNSDVDRDTKTGQFKTKRLEPNGLK